MGTLRRTCATVPRRGPLCKLLWANVLIIIVIITISSIAAVVALELVNLLYYVLYSVFCNNCE